MKGSFKYDMLHCRQCGASVEMTVNWWNDPGTRLDPPEEGFDIVTADACENCGHPIGDTEIEDWSNELYEAWPDVPGSGGTKDFDFEPDYDFGPEE